MAERLVIDLDRCLDCRECTASCSYPFHYPNNGIACLRELAAKELACRRCETHPCVLACPSEAVEAGEDGELKRYNMRCTGCLSCSVACPFGTLIPAALEFRDSFCDFCATRGDGEPECARTCPEGAVFMAELTPGETGVHLVGDHLAVRSTVWQKIEPAESK